MSNLFAPPVLGTRAALVAWNAPGARPVLPLCALPGPSHWCPLIFAFTSQTSLRKKIWHRTYLRYLFLVKYLGDSFTSFLGMLDITIYLDPPRTQPALPAYASESRSSTWSLRCESRRMNHMIGFANCSKVQQCVFHGWGSASLSITHWQYMFQHCTGPCLSTNLR